MSRSEDRTKSRKPKGKRTKDFKKDNSEVTFRITRNEVDQNV